MLFEPACGWQDFDKSDEVVEFIANSLNLVEDQGIWEHYNFSEDSSVWCSSESHATNQLHLIFESSTDCAPIKSLVIEMTNNSATHFKQLLRLKSNLKRQYQIRDI